MHLISERGSRYDALWDQEGQRVMVRVFVVDGSGYFAEGIRRHLELVQGQKEMTEEMLVESVVTGEDAIRMGRSHVPVLVFVDLSLPHESGLGLIRRFRTDFRDSKVVACSMYDQGWLVARTLAAGAHGYLVKSAGHEEFGRIVGVVLGGGSAVPDSVRRQWTLDCVARGIVSESVRRGFLSADDVRVVCGVIHGATTAELAHQFGCPESEVVSQRRALQERFGCRTAEDWCRIAMVYGLMPDSRDDVRRSGSA